ncbi:MAG: cell division protein FtsA [Bacteroidales bacterium]|nr:cell division protein FtsA [Bacteroidales bacterium]
MDNKHFVAIDAGSSKIALAVGYEIDGNFSVNYYKTIPSIGISKGRVQNVQHASDAIRSLLNDAKNELELDIKCAVANFPNYPIQQVECISKIDRDDTIVRREDIDILIKNAEQDAVEKATEQGKMIVYDCVAQSYSDGYDFQIAEDDIEGRFCEMIEGNFLVCLGKENPVNILDNTLGMSDLTPIKKYFTPQLAGRMVLDKSDRENGVALVDIGGNVTSVSIFTGDILRYFDSIPFGGNNITSDIRQECGISEGLAENIKKAYGICCPNRLLNMGDKSLRIKLKDATRTKEVWVKYISEIVTARMEEIFEAVLYMIEKSGFSDELRSGIVLTGGGAMLCNCTKLLSEMSGYSIRLGKIRKRFGNMPPECLQTDAVNCLSMLYAARELQQVQFVYDPNEPRITAIDNESTENVFNPKAVEEKPRPVESTFRSNKFFSRENKVRTATGEKTETPQKPNFIGKFMDKVLDTDEEKSEKKADQLFNDSLF